MWLEGWINERMPKVWFVGISDRVTCIVNHQEGIWVTLPKFISLYRTTFSLSI